MSDEVLMIGGGVDFTGELTSATVDITSGMFASSVDINMSGLLNISSGGSAAVTTVNSGGRMFVSAGGTANGVIVDSDGAVETSNGLIGGVTVNSGGALLIYSGAEITGQMTFESGAEVIPFVGSILDFDLTGTSAGAPALVNDLSILMGKPNYTLTIDGTEAEGVYVLAGGAASFKSTVTVKNEAAVLGTIEAGASLVNDNTGYVLAVNEGTLSLSVAEIAEAAAATSLTADGTPLANGDRAAVWGVATGSVSGNVFLAGDMTSGTAHLELDGYRGSDTILYGASGSAFAAGTVDIVMGSGTLRNLAAGADAVGTVRAVNLTFDGGGLIGVGYAGGFGNVTSETRTLISAGAFAQDFYAGALANYAKTGSATHTGNVALTIEDGEFSGNIYGAASVKAGIVNTSGGAVMHTAGDIELEIISGSTTKGTQACIFAGGYAAGHDTAALADRTPVYQAGNVSLTIAGGTWGGAAGGRGVFGGAFASDNIESGSGAAGVCAKVGDVNITISGGTMGNVYGGGWAQKNGKSEVGDVSISITGGTIANVFGGGTHSTSGGTTIVDDVSINVSGGNITGAIYAGGQLNGDLVIGDKVGVTFSGDTNFGCGVYGYSCVGGEASDALLSFTAYSGTFSGKVGGFVGIILDDDTAMTLTTAAADVANGKWDFDLSDRADTLAGTSMLTWSGADFENDIINVSFTDETQAKAGWNIATVAGAFSGTTFGVEVGGSEIATGLAYNQQIASGDYAGWGFDLESGVLKFKRLA